MCQTDVKGYGFSQPRRLPLLSSALLTAAWLTGGNVPAVAQSAPPSCQPPRSGEYLVLVVSETKPTQERIRLSLPKGTRSRVCQYVDNVVTRIGGLRSVDQANNLVRYMHEIVGLPAFVARMQTPPPRQTPSTEVYQPQLLGSGYAVLVDYSNQPQLATQVRQMVGGNVGLVSYGQRPYLLAVHTTNEREANSTLQQLSDRGFLVMLVDSRRVTLLRPQVGTP